MFGKQFTIIFIEMSQSHSFTNGQPTTPPLSPTSSTSHRLPPIAQRFQRSPSADPKRPIGKGRKDILSSKIQNESYIPETTASGLSTASMCSSSQFLISPFSIYGTRETQLNLQDRSKETMTKQLEIKTKPQNSLMEAAQHLFDGILYDKQKPLYIQNFAQANSQLQEGQSLGICLSMESCKLSEALRLSRYAILEVLNFAKEYERKSRMRSGVESLGLKHVCNSICQLCREDSSLERLKPAGNQIQNTETSINIFQILQTLQLLSQKVSRYEIVLSITTNPDTSIFTLIRDSLQEMQQELIRYSNSVYLLAKEEKYYPAFCYAYVEILWDRTKQQYTVSERSILI